MADVFISYHEKSAGELVEQITDALNAAGISCWCARRNLPPGAAFSDYIPQAIRNCKVFLLILNEGSNQSEHVKNELNLAFRRINQHEQITLIPFRVDNCVVSDSVDYFINRFQITDGAPLNEQHIQKLVNAVADILGKKLSQADSCMDVKEEQLQQKPYVTVTSRGGRTTIVCPFCHHTVTVNSRDIPQFSKKISNLFPLRLLCPRCKARFTIRF